MDTAAMPLLPDSSLSLSEMTSRFRRSFPGPHVTLTWSTLQSWFLVQIAAKFVSLMMLTNFSEMSWIVWFSPAPHFPSKYIMLSGRFIRLGLRRSTEREIKGHYWDLGHCGTVISSLHFNQRGLVIFMSKRFWEYIKHEMTCYHTSICKSKKKRHSSYTAPWPTSFSTLD